MVRLTGLEPALLSKSEPKSDAYASFATGAKLSYRFVFLFTADKIINNLI